MTMQEQIGIIMLTALGFISALSLTFTNKRKWMVWLALFNGFGMAFAIFMMVTLLPTIPYP